MDELESNNVPMSDIQRVIIETNERNPKIIAQVTANNFDITDDFRVRIKPVYDTPKQLIVGDKSLKDITITDLDNNIIAIISDDGQIIADKGYKVIATPED